MSEKPEVSEQDKPNPQLAEARFKVAEAARNVWVITVEGGLTRAQVTHPDFLGQVAAKLRPYDRIEVRCDDGAFYAELLVLEAARTYARSHVLRWESLTTTDVAQSQSKGGLKQYRVEKLGEHLLWCVIRNSDGAKIREQEPTKRAAETWLDDYVKVTA
jgi:hypothetical protein